MSKYGYRKVATAAFNLILGDIKHNKEEIKKLIEEAKTNNVSVLLFPELSLTGYTLQDMFLKPQVEIECRKALFELKDSVPRGMLVFIGLPFIKNSRLYDCCACLSNGRIIGIVPKTYLPSYAEFYENRHFVSGRDDDKKDVEISGEKVPFGTDLLFSMGDLLVGTEICEDLWVIKPPSDDMALSGCNLVVNPSASDDVIGKAEYREQLVRHQSAKNYFAYLYCSSGRGESSQDLVFSGASILYEEGRKVFSTREQNGLEIGLIDTQLIESRRIGHKTSFECEKDTEYRVISAPDSENDEVVLPEEVNPHPFIIEDEEKRRVRSEEILRTQAKGLATRIKNTGIDKLVIGVSGGLDSTLALLVCKEAMNILGKDCHDIHAFSLPSKATTERTFNNGKELIDRLECTYHEVNISKELEVHLTSINHEMDNYDTTYENAQARIRTTILMDYSNKIGGLVVGTSDLSEACLGFSTYNGDHMSMYAVNISIPKTLIQTLIRDYASKHTDIESVLLSILDTPISPELIPGDGKIVQKTEEVIGKYELHDFFIYHFLRNSFGPKKIYALSKIAFSNTPTNEIKKTLQIFFRRFFNQQFKRSCLPDGVKVGTIAISPRGDLRMPSDMGRRNLFLSELDELED